MLTLLRILMIYIDLVWRSLSFALVELTNLSRKTAQVFDKSKGYIETTEGWLSATVRVADGFLPLDVGINRILVSFGI